jgi:hypothetical protein
MRVRLYKSDLAVTSGSIRLGCHKWFNQTWLLHVVQSDLAVTSGSMYHRNFCEISSVSIGVYRAGIRVVLMVFVRRNQLQTVTVASTICESRNARASAASHRPSRLRYSRQATTDHTTPCLFSF